MDNIQGWWIWHKTKPIPKTCCLISFGYNFCAFLTTLQWGSKHVSEGFEDFHVRIDGHILSRANEIRGSEILGILVSNQLI